MALKVRNRLNKVRAKLPAVRSKITAKARAIQSTPSKLPKWKRGLQVGGVKGKASTAPKWAMYARREGDLSQEPLKELRKKQVKRLQGKYTLH